MSRKKSILYSLLGQLFLVLSVPIVTRFYLPETVGIYGEILAIATIIGINSALKLDVSLVSTPTKLKSKHILSVSVVISAVVSFLASTIYGAFKFNNLEFMGLLIILSFSISINQLLIYYETSRSNIDFISKVRLKRGFIAAFLQSSLGGISPSLYALVLSLAFSNFISLSGRLKHTLKVVVVSCRNPRLIKSVLIDKLPFCKYSLPQGLLNSISTNMPIIYLGYLGEYKLLGLYVVAERFIRSPVNFVNIAIRQIFIAEYRSSENKLYCYLKWFIPLVLMCLTLGLLIYTYSGIAIDIILGNNWSEVSDLIIVLLPWLILSIIQVPASGTFIVNNKIKQYALIEMSDFILKCVVLYFGLLKNDVMLSLHLFVFVGSMTYIVTVAMSLILNFNKRNK
ncbi:oligosaccharide flippase family protein [Vibrio sp. ED002]|uniref:lipopolysaccharide biosynthesis protein n=1 Tax=Vibrio sp. ED002 TaxID=2785123 RepID=UPI00200D6E6F|nr:oligosaccharide flippase family protein [Vibrio sp. ED002]UQA49533.1 oligosaccharide flippase family protein [Vibrio sp. ED002]